MNWNISITDISNVVCGCFTIVDDI